MMDFMHSALSWEQQWARWNGRTEIRWFCPPRRSLSPRCPSDTAAPLLSIWGLSSHNPLLSAPEWKPTYSLTVQFLVTVWVEVYYMHIFPCGRKGAVSPTLVPVSHPDKLPVLFPEPEVTRSSVTDSQRLEKRAMKHSLRFWMWFIWCTFRFSELPLALSIISPTF